MSIPEILYQCYLFGVPLSIAAAVFGFRWKEGLWGNALAVVCVLFAFLIAAGWWESLASFLSHQVPMMLFFSDLIAFWGIFIISLAVLCEATKFLSRVQVKYAEPIEKAGNGAILALLFAAMFGVFLFARDLEPVGYPEDATRTEGSIQISVLKLLSSGNLSSFTSPTTFDSEGNFRQRQLKRQQAIWKQYKDKEGKIRYEGQIPPRRR